ITSALPQQYIQIEIHGDYRYNIHIENTNIKSSQFYKKDDRNDILTSNDMDDIVIHHNSSIQTVYSIYKSQGYIDLVNDIRDIKIYSLAWGSSIEPREPNKFKKLNHNSSYIIKISKWNRASTIGAVPITIKEQS
ncbi:hypothetical protein N7478_002294, partial [Penicillium angulare]|uniref:uncharacterized protein n=1 Tax=Penicillium angulare TaxID=116970 RepID=UPI00253F6704